MIRKISSPRNFALLGALLLLGLLQATSPNLYNEVFLEEEFTDISSWVESEWAPKNDELLKIKEQ